MAVTQNWDKICSKAIELAHKCRIKNQAVRNSFKKIENSKIKVTNKHTLPPFLQENKDVCSHQIAR
jgi:hypothetical protein